jgi:hypothetical protein
MRRRISSGRSSRPRAERQEEEEEVEDMRKKMCYRMQIEGAFYYRYSKGAFTLSSKVDAQRVCSARI